MVSTSTQIGVESAITTANTLLEIIDNETKIVYQACWQTLLDFLSKNWLAVITILFIVFAVAFAKAIMGRWGMLGSVLYNYFYFGILFIIGLIWGSNIFVSDFFHLTCTLILYPVCYLTVGFILRRVGFIK